MTTSSGWAICAFKMERVSAESPYIEASHAFSANKISGVIEADAAMRPVKRGRSVGGQE